ncbi:MAG TPA: SDR family oxidoreductase [Candidatus Binataceae bacterium]|nr:SDR family oxidoreductase [Candidatus Binataceae bacterium]
MNDTVATDFSLTGKSALVVGAENPLGMIAAMTLTEAGADLVIASQQPGTGDALRELTRRLAPTGRKSVVQVQSAITRADLSASVDLTVKQLGGLDILVNALDYRSFAPADISDDNALDKIFDNTFRATWMACQEAGRIMRRRGGGVIVNVVSVLAERGVPNASLYCASQAAVLSLTRTLALEWAPDQVRVNALEFGWLESRGQRQAQFEETLRKYLPDHNLIKPEELAGALLYLVAPGARFMTGQSVVVDGGLLCHP